MAPAEVEEAIVALGQSLELAGSALEILDGFNHRNKNQHRLSRWFAEFNSLRRHLRKLAHEIQADREKLERFARYDKSPPKGVYTDEVKARVEHIRVQVVPKAFLSFSQLASDNQYAHLGLMLLGALAQVDKVLRLVAPETTGLAGPAPPSLGQRDLAAKPYLVQDGMPKIAPEDMGVVVLRDLATTEDPPRELASDPGPARGYDPASEEAKEAGSRRMASMKPKKRQRSGDEFDALFGALEPKTAPKKKKKKKKKKQRKADEFDDLFGSLI